MHHLEGKHGLNSQGNQGHAMHPDLARREALGARLHQHPESERFGPDRSHFSLIGR
ncbi:hypothetical protein T09_6856 [Trichinella sp. T9]|nr:hypothetical protein T09_6856 [Trichinella sp. T9]KRZ82506.1 hypothetical protein T08_8314 [Trichinella sp. T8]